MQSTLVKPEPKVEPALKKVEVKPESKLMKEINSGWTNPINKKALEEKKTKGVNYKHLELFTTSNLKDGLKQSINVSNSQELRDPLLGSSWGIGEKIDYENPKEYFDAQMKHKLETVKEPFKDTNEGWDLEHHHELDFYRTIPIQNHIVIVGDELKKVLKQKGFDFDTWYKKYMSIEEVYPSEEHDKKVQRIKELLEKEIRLLAKAKPYKESVKYKLGKTKSYNTQLRDYYTEDTLDEIMELLRKWSKEVKALDAEIKSLIKSLGHVYYSDYVLYGADEVDKPLSYI